MVVENVSIVVNHSQAVNILQLGKMVIILTDMLNAHIVEESILIMMTKQYGLSLICK